MTFFKKFMAVRGKAAIGLALFASLATTAQAQSVAARSDDDQWWVRAGPAWVAFDEKAELKLAGNTVPGAGADVKNNAAFLAELGYRLLPNLSLALTVGVPPTTTLTGNGTVAAVGKIGKVEYAPAALTLQYQFDSFARFHIYPYVGAGVTYLKIFDTSDGAVSDFQVRNAWGGLAQIGMEYRLTKHVGLFVDLKKFIVRTSATGALGGAPVYAHVRLDPLVAQTGLMIRF
ncbi:MULTISPECIES: OmpW/AlkL family protein [Paraburkholderia]|uniref:OmpW/AlkL family protein n=1 Tax=Paraburkholderia aromaticivorans TaxID=2026199 RepID=UPI0038B86094